MNYGFANPDKEKPWQSAVDSAEAKATRKNIMDIMRFWLSMDCDGFRVDMAASLVKGDKDHVRAARLWQEFRRFLDPEFPEAGRLAIQNLARNTARSVAEEIVLYHLIYC